MLGSKPVEFCSRHGLLQSALCVLGRRFFLSVRLQYHGVKPGSPQQECYGVSGQAELDPAPTCLDEGKVVALVPGEKQQDKRLVRRRLK